VRPDLSVVIVAYNSAHVIGDLLDSVPAALAGVTADVVVVDNSSTDGTAELVEARGDARVVRSANVGFAGGINRGVREAAAADAVLVLNPDVRLRPGSVPPLLAALRLPSTGVVAPRILSDDGTLFPSLRREPDRLTLLLRVRRGRSRLFAPGRRRLGPGRGAAVLPRVFRRPRRLGRVVFPLLRGDGFLPAGA
jgi:GT2 family glycosyltransferase